MEHPSWAGGLRPCGVYYEGFVADLDGVLQQHRVETVSTFSIRKSRKTAAGKQLDKENQNPEPPKSPKEPRLYWKKKEGAKDIEFEGIPFTADGDTLYNCQFGEEYFRQRECKNLRLRLQGTRKLGCLAHITVKQYTLYPAYQITECEKSTLGSWQLRQLREERLRQLRDEMKSGTPAKDTRYFISLPTREAHTHHPTDEVSGYAQKVHPLIAQKISEFVSAGMTDVNTVKTALRHYVHTQFSLQYQCQPSPTDRAFHPSLQDIRNHMHKAKKAMELSKLDQENLRLKVNQWEQEEPKSSHFFRPYILANRSQDEIPEKDSNKPDSFRGNSGGDDDWNELAGSHTECSQTFLWVYQTDWQKSLLARYGNNISMIDATYKTTKYELALFFVCVRTNVGYSVVGQFVTQSETAEHIQEALQILRTWNPDWNPQFFMSDYSEAEHVALEGAFPGVTIYLCDFHREQAWERWTNDRKHGLSNQERDQLLFLLRECANAPSPPENAQQRRTYYYDKAVETLKQSSIWCMNEQVKTWLEHKWLSIPKKWARCYRDDQFHADVNTNNGVEAQNKVLKYSYLPRKRKMTVSNLATLLVTTFLPEMYQKYLLQNYQMSGTYRAYKDFVPKYLHERPRSVILHCLTRKSKSAKFSTTQIALTDASQGTFVISSSSGNCYTVSFNEPQCSCKDWKQHRLPCKHFFAVFHHYSDWGWDKLPKSYLTSEYLTSDEKALAHDPISLEVDDELVEPPLTGTDDEPEQIEQTQVHSEIPRKQKSVSITKAQQALRITLKTIESLSYNCTDVDQLLAFNKELHKLGISNEGANAAPEWSTTTAYLGNRDCQKSEKEVCKMKKNISKYGSLEKQTKLKKPQESKFQSRVGEKAQRLRKVVAELRSLRKSTQVTQRIVPGQKRLRCGHCTGCRSKDCGQCRYCRDKPKYGGTGKKKQCCIKRHCLNMSLGTTLTTGSSYHQPQKLSKEEIEEGMNGPIRRFVKLPGTDIPDQPYVQTPNPVTRFEGQVQEFKLSVAKAFLPKPQLKYTSFEPGNIIPPSTTSKNYMAIQEALLAQERQLDSIDGDGNCLFRSISKELFGRERYHSTVRNTLVNFIEHNAHLFKFLLFDETMENHCKRMHQWGTWGSQIELHALSCLLQVEVFVFSPTSDNASYKWKVYKPQTITHSKLCFPESVQKIHRPANYHMELCHSFGVHFDRVVPRNLLLSTLQHVPQLQGLDEKCTVTV